MNIFTKNTGFKIEIMFENKIPSNYFIPWCNWIF